MEQLHISSTERSKIYEELLPQIEALMDGEPSLIANLANVTAALRQAFGFFWVGFYLVDGEELVLGPFQGDIACTRIAIGKGVCGQAWERREAILVPDVEEFPGHIACSSQSKSEIVVPIFHHDIVVAVLDVDSDKLNDFDAVDEEGLTRIVKLLSSKF
ncbi:MAG: GAF domain-containing protein [Flavobacteriales bacterium]|nr:GAF domain-containing protein [Flavobacteriales bacterium]MCB9190047.1 GAF domain-containing protein [Flavobacteriales bacterium]MCB9205149.1 GAF domain-containing protein [Flavobacteriales bacterium]